MNLCRIRFCESAGCYSVCPDQAWSRSDIARDHPCECRQESAASAEQGSVLPVRGLNLHAGWARLSRIFDREIRQTPRLNWTAPCCPLSPDFFADAAWCHMAAFLQKIGGEGRGEGPVFARCIPGNPPSSGLMATFSPRGGEGTLCTWQTLMKRQLR